MMRKNNRIATTSLRRGIESSNETTIILSPSIPEIVQRGLSTQKDLKTPMLTPDPKFISSKYPESTITKSSMFQASHRYAPLLNKKPHPQILRIISTEYKPRNTLSNTSIQYPWSVLVGS